MMEGSLENYRLDFKDAVVDNPRWFAYYSEAELNKILTTTGYKVTYSSTIQPKSTKYLHILCIKE